ncbi:hypothetical protein K2Z84_29015 [Candidatus Binatia bacterium]|nr:hypothetical protein [Candidatus Binatia bacterium]
MQFVSLEFLVFVALSLCAFHLAPSLRARRAVLMMSNVAFAAFLVSSPWSMAPMALFLAGSFGLIRLVHARRARGVLAAALVGTIGAFIVLKQYIPAAALFPTLAQPYSVIGLSYVLFRVLHVQIDCHEGALAEPPSARAFLAYCCFFPAWLSGPIQRYEDYRAQEDAIDRVDLSADEIHDALSRIVTGVFKIAVLSGVLLDAHQRLAGVRLETASPPHFAAVLAAAAAFYTLYMYVNFAGYMDVAIGVARLYGFHLPENFDHPFAAGSMLDFWTRWHITLSAWFRTYLFNPLLRALTRRWGSGTSGPYLGVVAYLVTFWVMGLWHGSTPIFVLYGSFLGITASGNKLWEIEARRMLGKDRFRRLRASEAYGALCRGAVFAVFSAALVCFWVTPRLRLALGGAPLLASLALLVLMLAAAVLLALGAWLHARLDAIQAGLLRVRDRMLAHPAAAPDESPLRAARRRRWGRQVALGVKTYAVLMLLLLRWTAVPTFVYVPF